MTTDSSSDWRPSATLEVLKLRARILEQVRAFFSARDVLEVETPILSTTANPDPALASLSTRYTGPHFPHGQILYLHTSPEFAMKRLLASGIGSIYQVCKVFRDGEFGRWHNPEFTMLEWYRVGWDDQQLMEETAELVTSLLPTSVKLGPTDFVTYQEAFRRYADLDPFTANLADYVKCAKTHQLQLSSDALRQEDIDFWRDLLLSHVVEPKLGQEQLTFLHHYPVSQAALARRKPGNPLVASRFELYLNGVELANGFHELADAEEQRMRFTQQANTRAANQLSETPMDHRLLAALVHGLPNCAGVAVGLDRVVMFACGARSIQEVLSFPVDRA